MQKDTVITKILLTLLVAGLILWLGGSVVRVSNAYEIYMPFTELELKSEYGNDIRMHTVKLFAYGSLYTGTGFVAMFIGFLSLAYCLRREFKSKGWLFISFVLFLFAASWGIYELILDIRLSSLIKAGVDDFNNKLITELFVYRFSKWTLWASMAYMSAIAAVLIIIWRPLNNIKKIKNGGNNETQ